jgi:hypothetical protein
MSRAARKRKVAILLGILSACVVAGPVSAGIAVVGPLNDQVELEPGGRHQGVITLQNGGTAPEQVKLVQYDYRVSHTGQQYFTDVGTVERSNAEWISVSPRQFVIPAGETYTIAYTIDVPVDDSLEGTYWSILMIEPVPPESPESREYDEEGGARVSISSLLRYAFTFVTTIGDTGTIVPEIVGATLRYADGEPILDVDIENVGTRILRISIWTELYDSAGAMVGRYDGLPAGLLPLSSLRYTISLAGAEAGSYTGLVVIDCGDNNVFGASFPISIE